MALLQGVLRPFELWNDWVLPVGRWISIAAIALMVVAILIQVLFRYVFNNALPWPDEAARFMMLWLTGLMAPIAFRQGGFVAIDMVPSALPLKLGQILTLILLLISAGVLAMAINIGWGEVTGFGGKFKTASLYVPLSFDLSEWLRVPRSWMMTSLFVGVTLLFIVNIELILRSLITLMGGGDNLRNLGPADDEIMAE
ncbi:MAG: TRAP transporter small permease [Silicimonas sp.]|nr:TRAP transporter small permease [Silicimonas sp.]